MVVLPLENITTSRINTSRNAKAKNPLVSENGGTPKSSISGNKNVAGCSIRNHPFLGHINLLNWIFHYKPSILGNPHEAPNSRGANPLQEISAKAMASHVRIREALERQQGYGDMGFIRCGGCTWR